MTETETETAHDPVARRMAVAAVTALAVVLVASPLIALSWHAPPSGAPDGRATVVRAWEDPARALLRPLLDLAAPQAMYQVLGLVLAVAITGPVCGVLLLARSRRGLAGRGERVCRRLAVAGYGLLGFGTLVVFLTGSDLGFLALMVPGMLLTLVGSTALGASLVRHRAGPPATRLLLVLSIPVYLLLSTAAGHNAIGLLGVFAAWGAAGIAHSRTPRTASRPARPGVAAA